MQTHSNGAGRKKAAITEFELLLKSEGMPNEPEIKCYTIWWTDYSCVTVYGRMQALDTCAYTVAIKFTRHT